MKRLVCSGSGEHGKDSAQHQSASNPNESQCMAVYLNRHTGLDRTCRVRFNIRVGGATVSTLESQVRFQLPCMFRR